jgi:cobalt/nickel transport system permease protein
VIFLLLVVTSAVVTKNPYPLLGGYGALIALAIISKLPWIKLILLSLYSAVFALLYSVSLHGGVWIAALFIVKAVTPAFAMLMLIVSTPYPRIFSLLSTVLPGTLAAGLFMTYRTLFILIDMMDNFAMTIRLRGGFSHGSLYKNSSNIAKGLGMLLVRAIERSTRLYAVMVVRGYSGSMAEKGVVRFQGQDWLPLSAGTLVLVMVMVWK